MIGDGNTTETADDETATDGTGGDTTDGEDGTGSGNQTAPTSRHRSTRRATRSPLSVTATRPTGHESGVGEEDPDESSDGPGDDPAPTPASDVSGDDPGAVHAGERLGHATARPPRASPGRSAAAVAGALPQTGAASGLLLWGCSGWPSCCSVSAWSPSRREGANGRLARSGRSRTAL